MVLNDSYMKHILFLLKLARNSNNCSKNEAILKDFLQKSIFFCNIISNDDINLTDNNGRTIFSYLVSNCSLELVELLLKNFPNVDINKSDNEGNSPLHFVSQAGQIDHLNYLLTREAAIDIDAKNNQGFTPLMKAAIQGRSKCAKLLLLSGANPLLVDNCRHFRAEQWARFCGRHVCADVIERISKNFYNCLNKTDFILDGKQSQIQILQTNQGLKSKLRKVFRSMASNYMSSDRNHNSDYNNNIYNKLFAQLTTDTTICASTPIFSKSTYSKTKKSLTVPTLNICFISNTEY